MATLLPREVTLPERLVQASLRRDLERVGPGSFVKRLPQELVQPASNRLFAAAMSLIQVPAVTLIHKALCHHLIATPAFLAYLGDPEQFRRSELVEIMKVLMKQDPRLDVKFARTLCRWKEEGAAVDNEVCVRLLGVLDELSQGLRLVTTLSRLSRALQPELQSKTALAMGRRVRTPSSVARQLCSTDARVRANSIEALWGASTQDAKEVFLTGLNDPNNRVVGNAVIGLWLIRHPEATLRLVSMLGDSRPPFRQTAAWAMAKTGDPSFRQQLVEALGNEEDPPVRATIERALEKFPVPEAPVAGEGPVPPVKLEPEPEPEIDFDLRLDGTFSAARLTK